MACNNNNMSSIKLAKPEWRVALSSFLTAVKRPTLGHGGCLSDTNEIGKAPIPTDVCVSLVQICETPMLAIFSDLKLYLSMDVGLVIDHFRS